MLYCKYLLCLCKVDCRSICLSLTVQKESTGKKRKSTSKNEQSTSVSFFLEITECPTVMCFLAYMCFRFVILKLQLLI